MSKRTTIQHILIRTAIVSAFVVMFASSTLLRAEANQSGANVDQATAQALLCEYSGGHATVDVDRNNTDGVTEISVVCEGGALDGWSCITIPGVSHCTMTSTSSPGRPTTEVGVVETDTVKAIEPVQPEVIELTPEATPVEILLPLDR